VQFNRVETLEQVKHLIRILPEVIAMDTEYVKGDPRTTELLSVILADDNRAWAVNPSLLPALTPTIKSRKVIFLQDYNHCDTIILLKNGCDLRETNCHNLIDMHHLIDENIQHDIGSRVLDSFGDSYKREFWTRYKNYEDASEEESLEYACKDAIYTYRLGLSDYSVLYLKKNRFELYGHIRQLSASLLETQLNGLSVNVKLMEDTKASMKAEIESFLPKLRGEFNDYCEIWEMQEWTKKISKLKTDVARLRVPRPIFNFGADKQVSWLVYEALGCPVINKTKTGNPATDLETLQTLSASRMDLRTLTEFKVVKSVYSTFVEGMLERVEDGKIYPSFNVSGTSTGRLSHSKPNMGNLPKTGVIRNFFVPSPGMCFIGADYSQLEVVIEANLTNDPQLLKIINEGKSKHDITAEGLGIDRNEAKTLNFALQYGAGAGKVSKILNVSKQEAEDIYQRYWELYSGVRTLKETVCKEIEETGQITNLAGRTRHFPKTNNKFEVYKQQRQAYNFLIQGLAAECCNRAFYRFARFIDGHDGRALFSVHDEILCEVGVKSWEVCKQVLVNIMEEVSKDFNFRYPLKAVAYGPLDKWSKE
jgi:DNA polymerase I-like protein with 3'-5' exonuclease and polymerase domains